MVEENTDDDSNWTNTTYPECEQNEYKLEGDKKLLKRKEAKINRYVRYHKDKDNCITFCKYCK